MIVLIATTRSAGDIKWARATILSPLLNSLGLLLLLDCV